MQPAICCSSSTRTLKLGVLLPYTLQIHRLTVLMIILHQHKFTTQRQSGTSMVLPLNEIKKFRNSKNVVFFPPLTLLEL